MKKLFARSRALVALAASFPLPPARSLSAFPPSRRCSARLVTASGIFTTSDCRDHSRWPDRVPDHVHHRPPSTAPLSCCRTNPPAMGTISPPVPPSSMAPASLPDRRRHHCRLFLPGHLATYRLNTFARVRRLSSPLRPVPSRCRNRQPGHCCRRAWCGRRGPVVWPQAAPKRQWPETSSETRSSKASAFRRPARRIDVLAGMARGNSGAAAQSLTPARPAPSAW